MIWLGDLVYLFIAVGLLFPVNGSSRFSGFAVAVVGAEERGSVEEEDGYHVERLSRALAVTEGGQLAIDTHRGAVRVESWDKAQVEVKIEKRADVFTAVEAERLFADFEIEIEVNGTDVQLRGRSHGDRGSPLLELSYVVKVPRRFDVELETIGGGISVGDLQGEVRVETSKGRIEIGHIIKGSVDARTSGGSVRITKIEGGNGQIYTGGGSIEVGEVTGDLNLKASGGSLRVGAVVGELLAQTAGGSIVIGRGGESIKVATAGGSIQIDAADGDVQVETAGGGIRVGPVGGNVLAETAGGSIQIGVSGGAIKAKTAGGSISVEGSGGPVVVATAGGSIRVREAHGYVEAETAGGNVEVVLAAVEKGRDMHCDLETAGGDVRVVLPEKMQATVDADIRIDEWSGAQYDIYSDFLLTVRRDKERWVGAKGEINGGGHLLKLSTDNGNIHIEKR